jgi:translocation and assembly module TamB
MDSEPVPRKRLVLRRVAVAFTFLLLALTALAVWITVSESAVHILLPRLVDSSVHLQGIHGRLLGPLQIDRVLIEQKTQRIAIDKVRMDWEPQALLHGELHVRSLHADNFNLIKKVDALSEPLTLPQNIALPLRLKVDSLQLDGGEISWGALNIVRLGGFGMRLGFDGRRYAMQLTELAASATQSASDIKAKLAGHLTLDSLKPYALEGEFASDASTVVEKKQLNADAQLKLKGTLAAFAADLKFKLGEAAMEGHAEMAPFSALPLQMAKVSAKNIDLSALRADLPHTRFSGNLDTTGAGVSQLRIVNHAARSIDLHGVPVRELQMDLRQLPERLAIERIAATLGGERSGSGSGSGSVTGNGGYAGGALTLALQVAALDLRGLDARLRPTSLAGRVDLERGPGVQALTLNLQEPVGKQKAALNARLTLADTRLAIERAELRLGSAQVKATGHLLMDGKQDFAAAGELRGFRPQDLGRFDQLPRIELNGRFKIAGARLPQLSADLDFQIERSTLDGRPLEGEGRAQLRADRIIVPKFQIGAGENWLKMQGELSGGAGKLDYSVDAPKLEQLGPGFGGALTVNGELHGSFARPQGTARWNASRIVTPMALSIASSQGTAAFTIDQAQPLKLTGATIDATLSGLKTAQQELASLTAKLQFAPQANAPLALDMRAAGLVTPQLRAERIVLTGSGTTAQHVLQLGMDETGSRQHWTATLNGGLQQLQTAPQWTGEVKTFEASGLFAARLLAPAPLSVATRHVRLGAVRADVLGAELQIQSFARDGAIITSRGSVQHLNLGQVLAFSGARPAISTDLRLAGEWDLKLAESLTGKAALRRESGDVVMHGSVPTALGLRTLEASADATAAGIALRVLADGAQLGHIAINATAIATSRATLSANTAVAGTASIAIPSLAWLGPLISADVLSEGQLDSEIALSGSFAAPRFAGRINGRALRLYFGDSGVDLRQGTLTSVFRGDTLVLNSLSFASEGGRLNSTGQINFAEAKPSANITVHAERYTLFKRSDRTLVLSGDTVLDWSPARARVTGTLTADSGSFDIGAQNTPQLSDDVVVLGSPPRSAKPLAAEIDMNLNLGKGVDVNGRGLTARVAGQIRLRSDPGQPLRAQGSVNVAEGTYTAYGRRLAIEQGVLRFNGPLNNPALDILAMRRGQEVEAGVAVRGVVLAPRITLVSEPTVPDAEKLSWLVLGRGLANAGNADLGALQTAAAALLSEGAATGVQTQIATAFGIDDFRIGSSNDNLQQRIITLGKRISTRLYVSYQQSLQSTGSILLLRYTLSPRLSIEAEAGSHSALSLFYNVSFD